MIVKAPAKINIGLYIDPPGDDGFHPIQTFMQTVDYCDEIKIDPAEEFSFAASGYNFPPGEDNLCVKAWRSFSRAVGVEKPVSIRLNKRIPVFSGMGGGSSDAAAVIRGLNEMWGTGLSAREMADIGAGTGSDVPFFLAAPEGSAFCEGRGEIVTPLPPLWKGWAVVIFTGLEFSTAGLYKTYDENLTIREKVITFKSQIFQKIPQRKEFLSEIRNDFADLIYRQSPALKEAALSLGKQGAAYNSITGSGSAVYGLFGGENEARRAVDALPPYPFKIAAGTPAPSCR